MGGSSFSRDDYAARATYRSTTGTPVFAHTAAIHTGKTKAAVHPSLDPFGVVLREARDSDAHPVTVPIAILLDVTGSMQQVPPMIEAKLAKLMGHFLEDKASGKKYLGEGYPSIMVGAVDDYDALGGKGCLQFGQFESGMEIDQNLENIWLTGNGGGTYHESYELGLYFMARHTVHDHLNKRVRKGYMFIIGDEHSYSVVKKSEIKEIIGDTLQADIQFADILTEVQAMYHVFFVIPNMTNHYHDRKLETWWVERLGQQNVLKLENPEKICELIVGAVAICEEHVGVADLVADGIHDNALVPLGAASGTSGAGITQYSAAGLPDVVAAKGVDRL